ncbi:MAG: hypothetical protein ACYDAM_11445 [Leptospirales bacterium]
MSFPKGSAFSGAQLGLGVKHFLDAEAVFEEVFWTYGKSTSPKAMVLKNHPLFVDFAVFPGEYSHSHCRMEGLIPPKRQKTLLAKSGKTGIR